MDTNKMREQFEAFASGHEVLKQYGFEKFPVDGDEYDAIALQSAWVAWQASREAVVVEMPSRASEAYREYFDDVEGGSFNEAAYIRDVLKAIEAQGLKVAP